MIDQLTLLLIVMTLAALWAVMGRSLLKATIGLAITSAVLSMIMFKLNAPLAAVFELSVCTGLITVVFVSTISLTKPLTHKEIVQISKNRNRRFFYLPIIIAITAIVLDIVKMPFYVRPDLIEPVPDVRNIMWNMRQLEIFAQIIVIIAGALGVVILFKGEKTSGQ